MGSYAWDTAEGSPLNTTPVVYPGRWVKILIPEQFGGGFIIGKYLDYGEFSTHLGDVNLMEWVALWNLPELRNGRGVLPSINPEYTDTLSQQGIDLAYSGEELSLPAKLVDLDAEGSYENFGASPLSEEQGASEEKLDDQAQLDAYRQGGGVLTSNRALERFTLESPEDD